MSLEEKYSLSLSSTLSLLPWRLAKFREFRDFCVRINLRDVRPQERSDLQNMSKFMCNRVDHYPHVDLLLSTEFKLMTLFSLTECFMSHADYTDYADNASLRSRWPSGCVHSASRQAASTPCDAAIFREIRENCVKIIFRDVGQQERSDLPSVSSVNFV